MLYVVQCLDKPGRLDDRILHRIESLTFIAAERSKVHIAGPLLDDQDRMIGSLIVVECKDRAEVDAFLAQTPYMKQGLYASIQVYPWRIVVGGPASFRE